MSFGSFALEGFVPDFDATVVTRVLQAGGTIIGKNVMNGLSGGFGTGGAIGDYGRPLNPHNHEHVTGGSSSGSGGGRGRGRGGHLVRRRPGRLHPHPGRVLRDRRPQADVRARVALRDRVRLGPEHRLHGPDDPHRGGRGGGAPGHRGVRPLRSAPDARCPRSHGCARPARPRAWPGCASACSRRASTTRRTTCATWCWPRSTCSRGRAPTCPRSRSPRTTPSARPRPRSRARARWRCSRPASSAPSPGPTTPPPLIAAINKLWASQADVLAPRTKLSLIAAELSRRNYHGRVYAKAQNVRPTYIKAYDAALADVDVLVMPTCIMTAPKNHRPGSHLEAVEDNLTVDEPGAAPATPSPSTTPATRRSPSPWASRRRVSRSACSSSGASSTIRSSCGSPTPTSTRPTGTRSSASTPER